MATEKRLIYANDLWVDIMMLPHNGDMISREEVEQAINDAQTVDAVEVVHGRWVLAKPRVKGRNATYRCTACGKLRSSYYNDVFQWEYCPCGAKMDGDGNG